MSSTWKHALCSCLLCRGHWFLRCSRPSAPQTNAAGASLLWWHVGCPTMAGQLEPTKPRNFQTRRVPEPCSVPACHLSLLSAHSNTILGEASDVSVTLHHLTDAQPVSGVGVLCPLELQRPPHIGSYFNLLQLVFFYFFLFSNSSCCVGVYTSEMCTNSILLNSINTLYAHSCIYLLWPEPAGRCVSQNNDAIRSYLFLFENVSALL